MTRGYFGVAVYRPKTEANIGTLWRSATAYGAAFLATVGQRHQRQASDTCYSSGLSAFHASQTSRTCSRVRSMARATSACRAPARSAATIAGRSCAAARFRSAATLRSCANAASASPVMGDMVPQSMAKTVCQQT